MTWKMESRHFLLIGKVASTILLLFVIFAWVFFLFVIFPMILFVMYHGKKKNISGFSLAMAMSPVGIVGALIWRLWSPDKNMTRSEKEYFRGIMDGHAEASYAEGKRQGYMNVSREEELSPIGVYDTRRKKK
jgi:hypothetical protein